MANPKRINPLDEELLNKLKQARLVLMSVDLNQLLSRNILTIYHKMTLTYYGRKETAFDSQLKRKSISQFIKTHFHKCEIQAEPPERGSFKLNFNHFERMSEQGKVLLPPPVICWEYEMSFGDFIYNIYMLLFQFALGLDINDCLFETITIGEQGLSIKVPVFKLSKTGFDHNSTVVFALEQDDLSDSENQIKLLKFFSKWFWQSQETLRDARGFIDSCKVPKFK